LKAVEIRRFGLEHLELVERERPVPRTGQVRIRMLAASLNARDLMMIEGRYNPRQRLPLVPCSDGVGEVIEVGAGVTRTSVGDRVIPIFVQGWLDGEPTRALRRTTLGGPLDGTLAEEMVLDESGLVAAPAYLTGEEAATLPCAAATAWSALVTHGQLRRGDTVLALGTGGVSVFALQLAVMLGARVIVTSKSDEKLDRARELGAWRTINYRTTPDWGAAVRELTDGVGVDHIIEVGGAGTLAQSVAAVRLGGRISLIGVLAGGTTEVNLIPIFMQQVCVQGVLVGHRKGFEAMNAAISKERLRPVVDRVFPLDEARAAFEHLASGAHFGKVVVRIGPAS
jgi:NADPH:quinone reductase-like Zn-dependent oxidoreductase